MASRLRAVPLCCLLTGLGIGPLRAEEIHFRRAVDIRMFCRPQPDPAAPTLERILPGQKLWVSRQIQAGNAVWYAAGGSPPGQPPRCWIYGPGTVEFDEQHPGAGWLAMLDRVLARDDVNFEEYVEVDNALQSADSPQDRKAIDESGPIQFRRLQMIARAVWADGMDRVTVERNPLKLAWILGHKDILAYAEPDGHWYLRKEPYRVLLERYQSEAWAEDIAWALTPAGPGDECYSVCALEQMAEGPLWYLSRCPAGAHAHEAMKDAAEQASYAAAMACSKEADDGHMPDGLLQKIRQGLSSIAMPEKQGILRSLDQIDRKCKTAK